MMEKTKKKILLGLIALSTLPFLAFVSMPSEWNLETFSLYISAFAGFAGVAIILWQYILGTRSVTGLYFKDLPSIISIHVKLGIWGTLLIFLHPLLLLSAYGESLLWIARPDFSSAFETYVSYGRISIFALLIVWVTSAVLRGKIKYRPWKYIHYLSYLALPFAFLHAPEIGRSFTGTAILVYWYSFIALFFLFALLRIRHFFGFGKFAYTVVSNKEVADKTHLIELKPVKNSFGAELGQYAYLQISKLGEEHPFSIVKIHDDGRLLVAYKVFGKFTEKLSAVKKGATMQVDGPYGVFTKEVDVSGREKVFIAGGIGVTPFIGHILDKPENTSLFYLCRSEKDTIMSNIFKKQLGSEYHELLTDKKDRKQFEADEFPKKLGKNAKDKQYFICGPTGMIDHYEELLQKLGVPSSNIHAERFSF